VLCKICKKEIKYDISFNDLFIFDYICKSCHNVIKEKHEVIPIDDGYLLYNYHFINEQDFTKEILELIYPKMITIAFKNRNNIILLDDEEIIPFIPFLNFKKDIIFLSIFRTDLMDIFCIDENEL